MLISVAIASVSISKMAVSTHLYASSVLSSNLTVIKMKARLSSTVANVGPALGRVAAEVDLERDC